MSVKPTPVNATVFPAGFVIVNVSIEVLLTSGLNDLLISGGAMTVCDSVSVLPGR